MNRAQSGVVFGIAKTENSDIITSMNKIEWKQHGYPLDMRRHPQRGVISSSAKFLGNTAIARGCDIEKAHLGRWQALLDFTRVIDNIFDGDADDKVDPNQIYENEYRGKTFLCLSGESVQFDTVKAEFDAIMTARRQIADPRELVESRKEELLLFMPMGELALGGGVGADVINRRKKFHSMVFWGGLSACLMDDLVDCNDDSNNGIHEISPTVKNKMILAQHALAAGVKGFLLAPKSRLIDVAKLVMMTLAQPYDNSLQSDQQ